MGMTIDKAKQNLHDIQDYYNDDTQDAYIGFDKEDNESVDIAIETMRKYQKIEELIEYHMLKFLPKERMSGFQKDILEVLENEVD